MVNGWANSTERPTASSRSGLHKYVLLDMLTHMRTSIELSRALFLRAKKLARERRTTLRSLVEEGLRRVLDEPRVPFRMEDLSFRGDGLVAGLDETDWDRIRDRSYEGRGG